MIQGLHDWNLLHSSVTLLHSTHLFAIRLIARFASIDLLLDGIEILSGALLRCTGAVSCGPGSETTKSAEERLVVQKTSPPGVIGGDKIHRSASNGFPTAVSDLPERHLMAIGPHVSLIRHGFKMIGPNPQTVESFTPKEHPTFVGPKLL